MSNQPSTPKVTSADFEKAAIGRFRLLASDIPQDCQVFREPWGRSTVICVDFKDCPHHLNQTQKQMENLVKAAQEIGISEVDYFPSRQKS